MLGRRRRELTRQAAAVISEAAAVVEGHTVDWAAGDLTGQGWAWTNTLAHTSWEDLRRLSNERTYLRPAWKGALSYLASEITADTGSPEVLVMFQRDVLIPLELDILAGRTSPPVSASELIAMIRAELNRANRHLHDRVHRQP